jgi:heme exporter protein D
MEAMGAIGGVVMLLLGLLVLLIAILWILMPFAIFGTKDLLRELIREQKRTNEILIAEARRVRARDGYKPDDDLMATR